MWDWKGAVTYRQAIYRGIDKSANANLLNEITDVTSQLSAITTNAPRLSSGSTTPEQVERHRKVIDSWQNRFDELNEEREMLERQLADANPDFARLKNGLEVNDLKNRLQIGSAFIDFFRYIDVGNKPKLIAFILKRDRETVVVHLDSADQIEHEVLKLKELIVAGERIQLEQASQRLFKLVWQPLSMHLRDVDSLIISPDLPLSELPWSLLPGKKKDSFLIEDFMITTASSAKIFMRKKLTNSSLNEGLLVLGNVDYGRASDVSNELDGDSSVWKNWRPEYETLSQWAPLPGFKSELEAVISKYRSKHGKRARTVCLSRDSMPAQHASKENFLRLAPEFRYLHLITHGFCEIDRAKPINLEQTAETQQVRNSVSLWRPSMLSGLILSGANSANGHLGVLRSPEIETSNLEGVDLAVLSACDTGSGLQTRGEGLMSLRRSFHIAGVRNVLASHWKVNDVATTELMRKFYEYHWDEGESVEVAFHLAQIWMIRNPTELEKSGVKNSVSRGDPIKVLPRRNEITDYKTTHPYFWAAFQLSTLADEEY